MHNEGLQNLYSSPNKIRMKNDEMDRECNTYGEKRNAYRLWWEARRKETTRKT
jgi:hypothetical protein